MSNATNFFAKQQRKIIAAINTALPCKVLSYDENTCKAKLQPLYKLDNERMSVLEDVPALRQRFRIGSEVQEYAPILHANDIVYVVFSKYALDDALNGNIAEQTDNLYRAHDAVIVGVF